MGIGMGLKNLNLKVQPVRGRVGITKNVELKEAISSGSSHSIEENEKSGPGKEESQPEYTTPTNKANTIWTELEKA